MILVYSYLLKSRLDLDVKSFSISISFCSRSGQKLYEAWLSWPFSLFWFMVDSQLLPLPPPPLYSPLLPFLLPPPPLPSLLSVPFLLFLLFFLGQISLLSDYFFLLLFLVYFWKQVIKYWLWGALSFMFWVDYLYLLIGISP